jgi:hypothetical protein
MRALIFILIIIVLVIIAGLATGFLDINQLRGARAPQVSATRNGITARGGQAPAFEVQTGSVKVGAKETTVKVPALEVQKPDDTDKQANAVNAM